ncbi:MAG: dihydrolipoamide acyltransferase, partial [Calditrichaeota bacterium]|nr:dihydrolipoamide acyltransferase [Calditrichota bacterium]
MAIPIQMPRLSDTMEEGVILKWIKKEGDTVQPGEALAEVETDKANMELEAFDEGTLLKILVEEGQRVPVGAPIAVLGEPGEDISQILGELGVALAAKAKEEPAPEVEETTEKPPAAAPETETPAESPTKIKASPLARKLALEHGLDLRGVKGSGPDGRIVKRDVEALIAQKAGAPAEAPAAPPAPEPAVQPIAATEDYEDLPLSMMREAVAKRMVQSKAPVPHFYLTVEVDMDALVELRES